jgi:uncharacterized protein YcsI (UPF0317 family)
LRRSLFASFFARRQKACPVLQSATIESIDGSMTRAETGEEKEALKHAGKLAEGKLRAQETHISECAQERGWRR